MVRYEKEEYKDDTADYRIVDYSGAGAFPNSVSADVFIPN